MFRRLRDRLRRLRDGFTRLAARLVAPFDKIDGMAFLGLTFLLVGLALEFSLGVSLSVVGALLFAVAHRASGTKKR